jgi:hypothetical protein
MSATVAALAPNGRAEPNAQQPTLVLESHVGERPHKIAGILATLDEQLETHGFIARPASVLQLAGANAPRVGVLDRDLSAASITQHLEQGFSQFGNGDCDRAVPTLRSALGEVDRNPELLVNDTGNLDVTFNAMVSLSVCLQRQQDAGGAMEQMKEVIRRFPSRPVSRQAAWGKEGETLYVAAAKVFGPIGRGRLSITGGAADSIIFVEDQLRGFGHVSLADLVPGHYHVFIWLRKGVGRAYERDVAANDEATLVIKPEFDGALALGTEWVGFEFGTETARRAEAAFASDAAKTWANSNAVALVDTATDGTRPAIEVVLYHDGTEVRRARVYTDVADPDAANKLAAFLEEDKRSPGLEVLKSDAVMPAEPAATGHTHVLAYTVGGVGVAGIVASIVMISYGGPPSSTTQEYYRDLREPGYFVGGAGLLAVGASLYLLFRPTATSAPVAGVTHDTAMLGWAGRW